MHKLLYLFGNYKNLHKFEEKRFIKITEKADGEPLSRGPKQKGAVEVKEEGDDARREVQDETAKPLTEKEILDAKLKSLTDPELSAILDKGQIDIEVEIEKEKEGGTKERVPEKRTIKLEAFQPSDVDKIITACDKTPACFDKVLQSLTEGKFNAGQFSLESRKTLINHYKEDKDNLEKLLKALVGSSASIRLTIDACEKDAQLLAKVFESIPDKAVISELNTDTIVTLINAGLYQQLIEDLSDNQKAELLSKEIEAKTKGWLFTRLFKGKELNQDATIVNALITYSLQEGNEEKFALICKKLDSNAILLLNVPTAKILIAKLKGDEKYKDLLAKVMESLPQGIKRAIEKAETTAVKEQETASTQAFFSEFPEKTSFEDRINAAFAGEKGVEIGKSLGFYVPSVGGIKRSFRLTSAFKKEIQKCKSPAEVKKACYEHLLKVITKDGSIRSNKWKIGEKAGESNQSLVLEIERLTALIAKESETPELSETEEYQVKQSAKRRLVLATLGGEKGDKYEVTDAGEIKIKGDDPHAAFKELQEDMGATQAVTEPEFKAAVEKAPKEEGEGKTIDPGAVIEAPTAKEEKLSEFKDKLKDLPELKKILEALLKEYDAEVTINDKTKSLEIKFKKTPDNKDTPANLPIFNITPSDKEIVLSYENIFVKDIYSFTLDTKATNDELKAFISQKYSDALHEHDTHMAHVDYFFEPERLKGEFEIKDKKIQSFDGTVDNSGRDWEKNWEKIKGHEKIEEVFSRSPFNEVLNKSPYNEYKKEDRIPAIIRDIVQEGSNSVVTFEDILEITKVLSKKALQKSASVIKDSVTQSKIEGWLGKGETIENILEKDTQSAFIEIFKLTQLAINATDTPEEKKQALREEARKMYNIYLGSAVILETLQGATLQEIEVPKAQEKQAVSDEGYQYLGHFETAKGETIPVYTDSEGKLYQSTGTGGAVEPLIDATVRMKAEKSPKFQEATSSAKLNVAKREYSQKLMQRIEGLSAYPFDGKKKVELKGTKVEITLDFNIGKGVEFPKFYLEPQLELNKETNEWVLKDTIFSYQRFFVGDLYMGFLGPNPKDSTIIKKFTEQTERIKGEVRDYNAYASIDLGKFEILDINKSFEIPEQVQELTKSEGTWTENFKRLQKKELYEEAFTSYFGTLSKPQVSPLMLKIIEEGSDSKIDLNHIFRITKAFGGQSHADDSWAWLGDNRADDFSKRFSILLKQVKGGLKLTNPDGSPNAEALQQKEAAIRELRAMYDMYTGGMKILRGLETDKVLDRVVETATQYAQYQIDTAQEVAEGDKHYGEIYYNFNDIADRKSKPTENKGDVQIGISTKAHEKFIQIYKEATGKTDVPGTVEMHQILRTVFRAYPSPNLLLSNGTIKREPQKDDGITRLLLVDFPKDFTSKNPGVKKLMEALQKDHLTEEPSAFEVDAPSWEEADSMALTEIQSQLEGQDVGVYKAKMLELLKLAEARAKGKVTEWGIFSDAVDLQEEMTLTSTAEHLDAGTVRRFTSPEAMVDHLFETEEVKIRIYDEKQEKYTGTETLKIFKWENGVKKIDEKALIKFFNYLIQEGIRRQKRIGEKQEKLYDYDDMMGDDYQVGTWGREATDFTDLTTKEEEALASFKNFIKTPAKDTWEKIPGHERIDKLLTGSPFDISQEDVPKKIHELLKADSEEINMERIFNMFLKEKLQKYTGLKSTKINTLDDLNEEYKFIVDKGKGLMDKIRDNDFEGTAEEKITKKTEAKRELAGLQAKYLSLKVYTDAGAALIQRLEKLGKELPSIDKLKIPEDKPFLQLKTGELKQQTDLLSEGYVSETERDKQQQIKDFEKIEQSIQLSKHPNIAKIQVEAFKKFKYPAEKIPEIEKKVLAAIGVSMEGASVKGAGIAIPINLGEGVTVVIGASNMGVAVGFGFKVVETAHYKGEFAIAGGFDFTGNGFISLGYFSTHEMTDTVDFHWGIGAIMTAAGPAGMVGLGFSHNPERAAKRATELLQWQTGYKAVEEAETMEEKVKIIKKLPDFKAVADKLDDVDLLAVYEEYKQENLTQGLKDGQASFPITGGGAGVIVYPIPPFIEAFIGIELTIGYTTLIRPRIGERAVLAQFLSQEKITSIIKEKLGGNGKSSEIKLIKLSSPKLYTDVNGRIGVLERKGDKITGNLSDLEALKTQLQTARMDANLAEVSVGEKGKEEKKKVVALSILDTDKKDVSVYIDDTNCPELKGIFDKNSKRFYIPGDLMKNIIITRETFKYPYAYTEGGATSADVIVITTNPSFNRNAVIKQSATYLEKRWEKDSPLTWERRTGADTTGFSEIDYLDEYQGTEKNPKPLRTWAHKDYVDTIYSTSTADFKEIQGTASDLRKTVFSEKSEDEITSQESRFDDMDEGKLKTFKKDIYDKYLGKLLRSGKPTIYDFEAIIQIANTKIYKEEPLNDKEAGQFLSIVQHLYFVNIWGDGKDKAKIKREFKENNGTIRDKVLYPKFLAKITKLGIEPKNLSKETPAGPENPSKEQYAKYLATKVFDTEWKKFEEKIDQAANFDDLVASLPEGFLFYSGTTIRSKRTGTLTGGAGLFDVKGVPKMGILGTPTDWSLEDANEVNVDIAKIILEINSPRPNLEKAETLFNPLAIKLVSFEATGLEIGKGNYKLVADFYKLLRKAPAKERDSLLKQELEGNTPTAQALQAFIEFANKVRDAVTSGEEPPQIITLKNGAKMVCGVGIKSVPYGRCGNISLMAKEDFGLLDEKNIVVASTDTVIHTDTDVRQESISVCIGVHVKPKVEGGGETGGTVDNEGEVSGTTETPGKAPKATLGGPGGPGIE